MTSRDVLAVAVLALAGGGAVVADEVPPRAIAAFERYVAATEARMLADREGGGLLWRSRLPASERAAVERRLARGEVVTQAPRTSSSDAPLTVPDAVFLHSVAAVFLHGASVEEVVRLLEDYDRHAAVFAPTIRRSRVVGRRGDATVVAGQFAHRSIVTIVYNAELEAHCAVIDAGHAECRSVSRRGAMVADAGRPTEREKPFRGDPAKQWFLRTYYRVAARANGVDVEHETLFVCPPLSPLVRIFTPLVRDVPAEVSKAMLAALLRRLSRS